MIMTTTIIGFDVHKVNKQINIYVNNTPSTMGIPQASLKTRLFAI